MNSLIDKYSSVFQKIKTINTEIQNAKQKISNIKTECEGDIPVRIANLEETLVKVDEYLLKVKGFQELAKRNLESQNVLTIEAPPGYRVNLNRLKHWASLIDPSASNDPYAQRVFVVAKCDEHFLEQKKVEFTKKIEKLKSDKSQGMTQELARLENEILKLKDDLKNLATSPEVYDLCQSVVEENQKYWYEITPMNFENRKQAVGILSPGAYAAPLNFEKEQREHLKKICGRFYDADGGRVLLPVEFDCSNGYAMLINATPSRGKQLDIALRNFILNIINSYPAGMQKIYALDGNRYNSSSIGSIKQLENTFVLEPIPRNPEQLTATLEQIVSSFADIDDTLALCDSVSEYNEKAEDGKKIPCSTIIFYGWPNSFEGRNRDLIRRIMTNYERYGISFIVVSYDDTSKKDSKEKSDIPEYALHNAIKINMFNKETTICFPEAEPQKFVWYSFSDELSSDFVSSVKECKVEQERLGNEYTKRYSLTKIPPYERTYKKLELPFGIDGKDAAHSISFENENFATYLVGASRSGKSTLLHTLIAGLIRNYHPDNVELWLADFKQLEFKKYIKHLPPHVKYVLLDESTELVFDLVDRLTAEMLERQKLFARLGKQRIDQINPTELSKPLPIIFVILDEFSIMSQSIAESQVYKLRLQNLLAKGAALGIRFLFSSQTFTTGVAGLTSTARAQIQQRIAMKGSKEEISETLELSANLKTEQVRNWMEALPPHYALVKFRSGADTLPQVKRFYVMYFENYSPRDKMIDTIRESMKPCLQYNTSDIACYVDKHPVLVDGNTFDAFNNNEFVSFVRESRNNNKNITSDEKFISFGTPRLMVKMKPAILSNEARENILLIARANEQSCTAAIMISAMKSFALQKGKVEIWAYGKNRIYQTYKKTFEECGFEIIEGIDAVCDAIKNLKQSIINKKQSNKLIVMIGMDRICMDFDYIDSNSTVAENSFMERRKELEQNGAFVTNESEVETTDKIQKWLSLKREMRRNFKAEGKSQDEIKELLKAEETRYFEEHQITLNTCDSEIKKVEEKVSEEPVQQSGAYNAKDDFIHVMKHGSRLGYHFLMNLNAFTDVKQSGLKPEFFRHKLSFQLSVEDSRNMFGTKVASTLPEHICQYDDSIEHFSFRPYLHKDVSWDGWYVDEKGNVVSPYEEVSE